MSHDLADLCATRRQPRIAASRKYSAGRLISYQNDGEASTAIARKVESVSESFHFVHRYSRG